MAASHARGLTVCRARQDVLKLPGDVFKKLSSVVRPTDVGRDTAYVNVSGVATRAVSVSSSAASQGFRRMNSASAVAPGASHIPAASAGIEKMLLRSVQSHLTEPKA